MGAPAQAQRGASETFLLVLPWVSPVEVLQEWFDAAEPGSRAVYAGGERVLLGSPGDALVKRWIAAGEVRTFHRPDPLAPVGQGGTRRWQFLVERCDTASARARKVQPDVSAQQLVVLHRALVGAAIRGEACPSRTRLAEVVTGQTDERAQRRVRTLMARLEAEGRIAIAPAPIGARHGPVVTILTGKHAGKATQSFMQQGK